MDAGRVGMRRSSLMVTGCGVGKITIKKIRIQNFIRGKAVDAKGTFRVVNKAG
jgi:hypothetical protein